MNKFKPSFYIVLTVVIAAIAIISSLLIANIEREQFVIGITPEHEALFKDTTALTLLIDQPVKVTVYENEMELIKAIHTGDLDAYITNPFYYIEQYTKLDGARAVLGVPSDYYVIALKNSTSTQNRVGVFESFMPTIMLTEGTYSNFFLDGTNERMIALDEDFVSHAIIHASHFDASKHDVISKMSEHGFTQDLLIITSEWVEYDAEHNNSFLKSLDEIITQTLEKPIEAEIISAMTYLFRFEHIETRYYYKDLVYMAD